MKRKKTSLFGLFSMALFGFIYANLTIGTTSVLQQFSLNSIEVLSTCEVSSNASDNRGYCMKNFNFPGDSCTEDGDNGAVRCSGNI